MLQGFGEAVFRLDVLAAEGADELRVMVAGYAERRAGLDHAHDQAQRVGGLRAAVHEVAQEDHAPALRRFHLEPRRPFRNSVAELLEELDKLIEAAVHVADNVEWSRIVPAVGPQPATLDGRRRDLLGRGEDGDVPEAFALEAFQGAAELAALVADDVRAEVPVRALPVALVAELLGEVEDDGDG